MPKTVAAVASPRCAACRCGCRRGARRRPPRASGVRRPVGRVETEPGCHHVADTPWAFGSCPSSTRRDRPRADPDAPVPAAGAPTCALPTTIYYPAQGAPAVPSTDGADVAQDRRARCDARPLPCRLLQPRRARVAPRLRRDPRAVGGRGLCRRRADVPGDESCRHHRGNGPRSARPGAGRPVRARPRARPRFVAGHRRWSRRPARSEAHRGGGSLHGRPHVARPRVEVLPGPAGEGRGRPRRRLGEPARAPDPARRGPDPLRPRHATTSRCRSCRARPPTRPPPRRSTCSRSASRSEASSPTYCRSSPATEPRGSTSAGSSTSSWTPTCEATGPPAAAS